MDSSDTGIPRSSKLPTASKIPSSPARNAGLSEMSASMNNVRSTVSNMPPPAKIGSLKHKMSGLPEPPAKRDQRETLMERAGRPLSQSLAAPTSNRVLGDFNGAASTNIRPPAPKPTYSHSRSTSSSSNRIASGSSFASSVGHGTRPPSSLKNARPGSRGGLTRTNSTTSLNSQYHRQANQGPAVEQRKDFEMPELEGPKIFASMADTFTDVLNRKMTEKEGSGQILQYQQGIITDLTSQLNSAKEQHKSLYEELMEAKNKMLDHNREINDLQRSHDHALSDLCRERKHEVDDLVRTHKQELRDAKDESQRTAEKVTKELEELVKEMDKTHLVALQDKERELQSAHEVAVRKMQAEHDEQIRQMKSDFEDRERSLRTDLEAERNTNSRQAQEAAAQSTARVQELMYDVDKLRRELEDVRLQRDDVQTSYEREKAQRTSLEDKLTEAHSNNLTLDSANKAMRAKIDFLESDNQAQSNAFGDLHREKQAAEDAMNEALDKLRAEETLRRKLHNQVQELKGNIRVMCRVRPQAADEAEDAALITYPDAETDCKEVVVQGPEKTSALGVVTTTPNPFSFDRIFGPTSQNAEIFEEISQLVQSALDGYNVCIFCYGQTGSGKTYTMSSPDGMIPRATAQIYNEAQRLAEKGWVYTMHGSFVEVYNENLNDLLGKSEDLDKKKLEIRHDLAKKTTTITDVTTVELDSADRVEEILKRADTNRTVAATKANMRSSRSHSVFILKLLGTNSVTGESSSGTLNLVDLAGSERLAHSQAAGDRLKETQNINKSLSCLGDVIAALGNGKGDGHIPYRNSKLTYLLQNSLGGNSKTLMFVMVSPARGSLGETLTSLKFATKVHNTHIGTAKKQSKVRD